MIMRKKIVVAMSILMVLSFVMVVSSTIVQRVVEVKAEDRVEEPLVLVNGVSIGVVEVKLNNGNGEIKVVNKAPFTFEGKIVNVSVERESVEFLVKMNETKNGIWDFYYDDNSNGLLDKDDIKMGEVKIEQGSSSLDRNKFTVKNEKVLKITMRYKPYVETGNYVVRFEIVPIYERYGS
jgi:type II secretory pathway component PulJ